PRPTATSRARARRPNTLDQAIADFARFAGGSPEIIREDAEIAVLRRKLGETIADETPKTGEQVKARHILVADEDAAKKVVERVKGGESFDTVAAEVSTDGSNKDKGGDLGWFGKGMMVSEFETAAYALKVGEMSAPVKTQFGWHVIRLDDRDATKPLDDAQWSRAKEETFPKWLENSTRRPCATVSSTEPDLTGRPTPPSLGSLEVSREGDGSPLGLHTLGGRRPRPLAPSSTSSTSPGVATG
ncbi:MAG: hypothetical protein EBS89_10280, partial [Proteobacteria bacterium]|nr:hypothetical protein [Pseudomonadota bacterium]